MIIPLHGAKNWQLHRRTYRKRTELVVEVVQQLETEGEFPQAHYAFDNGVLTVDLTRLIERCGTHWVSEIECSRHINWRGQWRRVDQVAAALRVQHPESFRPVTVKCRNGEEKPYWVFSKVVRLKKSLNFSRFVAGKQAAECDGSTPKGSCEPTEILRVAS
jgi:hypothetical protein